MASSYLLTKAEKQLYRVDMASHGWRAQCPDCNERFVTTDWSVTQAMLVGTIKDHQKTHARQEDVEASR